MISLIAAIGKNNELGYKNKLIWDLPNDLKFFRRVTIDKTVVMGLNTFNSIGCALPKRKNIVLTDDLNKVKNEDVIVYDDIKKLIETELKNEDEVFIIGGQSLYNYFISFADRLYLTLIDDTSIADVYFPSFDETKYKRTILGSNEDNGIKYEHVLFERIN